jgi:hypothetical protein
MIFGLVKVMNATQITTSMREIFLMEKLMVKEFILGRMGKSMMENGEMELKKATGYGREYLEILILVNGRTLRQKAMEFISGKMGIDMKENGLAA